MTHKISSQEDFDAVKSQFNNSSQHRGFKERFHFDPTSYIEKTGMPIHQALPKAKLGGDHWRIFEAANSGLRVSCSCNQVGCEEKQIIGTRQKSHIFDM